MSHTIHLRFVLMISFISALGGYLFGFDFAVISGALPFLKDKFGMSALQQGFTTASLALGCIAGCLLAGRLSALYGRRSALMVSGAVFAVSSLMMAASPNLSFLVGARFIAGIGVGMASMLSPLYIAEVSPPEWRGRMVSLNQLAIVIGILLTNLINYGLRNQGDDAWRWMFGLGAAPAALFCAGILLLPESPRWLIAAGHNDRAQKVLLKLGREGFAAETLAGIEKSLQREVRPPVYEIFRKPFAVAVYAGITLAIFQQFCGINVVFNYTPAIFESVGFDKDDQLLQTIFIGAVNLVFTFIALALVDRVGRKPLMIAGAAGLTLLYIFIARSVDAGSAFTTVLLLAAIGLYASTIAPVTWVLISEIFPNRIREVATTVSVVALWAAYFVLTFTFPLLAELMGGVANTFYLYSAICLAGVFFIWFRIRETKGRSLESMDEIFRH